VANASLVVSRRRSCKLDRVAGRGPEHAVLGIQLTPVRFTEGWLYVLGVGVVGGMALAGKARRSAINAR
jgi:hypothetical protein